jgi:hypothetical protein
MTGKKDERYDRIENGIKEREKMYGRQEGEVHVR